MRLDLNICRGVVGALVVLSAGAAAAAPADIDNRWFVLAQNLGRCISAERALGVATPEAAADQFARDGAPLIMVQRTAGRAVLARDAEMNGALAFIKGEMACRTALAALSRRKTGS